MPAKPKSKPKTKVQAPARAERVDKHLMEALGAQVKVLRRALSITASEVAQAAGLSALFMKFDQKRDATFVKAGQGLTIDRRGTRAGHRYELLGHSVHAPVKIEPFLITLDETSDAYPVFQHAGYEFIYMLSGAVTYRHADRSYLLQPGDSLFFDSEAPHGPEELRRLPARYLSIIVSMP
jgi:mannose-6-phosphate isomerase-like protein (cupin superfamily)